MNTLVHSSRSPAANAAPVRPLRAALAAWQQRRQASAALRALQALDAHALRDLGIDRSELTSLVHDAADVTRARAHWSC
jgi:uncharacterized protein YjiS (DUF1127 family)